MIRVDSREPGQLRPVKITPNPLRHPLGSALIELGETKVLCAVTLQDQAPPHRRGSGQGWLTAEYAMLPCSSAQRIPRDGMKGKPNGRSVEIQRLIGRVLRTVVRLDKLGERTLTVDCDVIEADGGTRTAAITGSFVALALAVRKMKKQKMTNQALLTDFVAATSVGMVEGQPVLDLCYMEDSQAEVDMNVAATGAGNLLEVQGTSEQIPCSREQFNELLDLAQAGCDHLVAIQKEVLGIAAIEEI